MQIWRCGVPEFRRMLADVEVWSAGVVLLVYRHGSIEVWRYRVPDLCCTLADVEVWNSGSLS